jgi:hypothetical protein
MKTITFNLMVLAVILLSFSGQSQTFVYDDNVNSGIIFQGTDGAEVANPISDSVNSSSTCAMSSTDGNWQQIQFFPNISVSTGDKFYFSVYNPNNVGPGQIQFVYASAPGVWQYGGDVSYDSNATNGWIEHNVNLSSHAGEVINKIIFMPAGNNSSSVYVDNIYVHTESIINPPSGPTYVYSDSVSSIFGLGISFDSTNGGEVANPVSDDVNSSANCAFSGTDASPPSSLVTIQIFLNSGYTPVSGDKLFFSVYNPNSSPGAQIRFNYTEFWGGNVTYDSTNTTGWVEYSIDLDDEIGNEITHIMILPTQGTSIGVYLDNIYFSNSSVLSVENSAFIDEGIFITQEGIVNFERSQNGTELYVFDITGRLIFKEIVNGRTTEKSLNKRGIYIVKAVNEHGITTKKLGF